MTFDLYNSQTPQSPDCRTSKKCSGNIGVSEKNSVENSPWGEENPSWLIAYYFLFRDTTFHLVLALSASLRPKYGNPYLFTSANLKHTLPSDVILSRTTLFQPILPPSGPCNAPWFSSKTLALYKSLTYLLTCSIAKRTLCATNKSSVGRTQSSDADVGDDESAVMGTWPPLAGQTTNRRAWRSCSWGAVSQCSSSSYSFNRMDLTKRKTMYKRNETNSKMSVKCLMLK